MRCNHCDDAPCISICPTGALFRRSNGIVDFDTANCIGCKSCMNACPYDALYIDPQDGTAQKCNFCAHRVDVGLAPSCVIVCPTQSIYAGDLDDPSSRIAQMISRHPVAVRSPEQGTKPKVFYKGAVSEALDPLQSVIANDGMIFTETKDDHPSAPAGADVSAVAARTAYTTRHPMPWRGMVSAYLVTKSIGAGALLVAALLVLLGHEQARTVVGIVAPLVAGLFTLVTAILLIADLKQPARFYLILTRPQWSSWLTRGSVILGAYAMVVVGWLCAGFFEATGAMPVLAGLGALLGAAAAGYTAFLFAQCEGRDLWQTRLMLPMLLAQAVAAGAAAFLLINLFVDVPSIVAVRWTFLAAVAVIAMLVVAEVTGAHSAHVKMAIAAMTRGAYSKRFWIGGVALGIVVPGALVAIVLVANVSPDLLGGLAGLAAVAGLAAFEDAFVRAGQSVPLS
jgi:formate-dependent nitrite reductase membrane component NrfD/NAD-dependent dihydropyrimidine dehydrogenase PreA subunit